VGALAARRASWVGVLAFSLCWGASAGWMASAAWAEQAGKNLAERGPALTLKGCYERALKQSGEIAIRRELLEETEAHFQQAASALLPRATFSSSDKRQDGSGASLFTLRDVPERRFVLTQPLFAGFKEFSAMAATKAERRQRTQEKARAEQLLLLDVAGAFYLLLEKREEVSALEATRETLVERMDELRRRQEIGRSRPSEVASAEAQVGLDQTNPGAWGVSMKMTPRGRSEWWRRSRHLPIWPQRSVARTCKSARSPRPSSTRTSSNPSPAMCSRSSGRICSSTQGSTLSSGAGRWSMQPATVP